MTRFSPHCELSNRSRVSLTTPPARYVPATFSNAYGPKALFKRLIGRPFPPTPLASSGNTDNSSASATAPPQSAEDKFKSQGYRIHEVGPPNLEGKGLKEFEEEVMRLKRDGWGLRCPF